MARPDRRDPCPCGSGRPYRDCCGRDTAARFVHAAASTRETALGKLLAYAFQPSFDTDHTIAETLFWGDLIKELPPDEVQALIDSEDSNIKYNSWFLFDWEVDDDSSVAGLFLDDPDIRLSNAERRFIERVAGAPLRLYEVEAVTRGTGVRLIDLWSNERLFVFERSATSYIARWDLLGARVAPDEFGGHVFEGGLYLYPADVRSAVLGRLRRLYRRYTRAHPAHDATTFFRRHGHVFQHLWLEHVAFPEAPQIVTAEGDEMAFCRTVFDVDDADAVKRALEAHPEAREVGDGRFAWREEAEGGAARLLGTLTFESGRLVLETMSQARAERGRQLIEQVAGPHARFRATAIESVEQAFADMRRATGARPSAPTAEVDGASVRDIFDRHYAAWVDQPVPALGNRTPREAARMRLWRPRVVELLKQLENRADRDSLSGRQAYDFTWLWKELRIDRPGEGSATTPEIS